MPNTLLFDTRLLLPVVALVLVTFLVWLRLYQVRIGHMRREKIHPQKAATRASASQIFAPISAAADNFLNLFELPVLFYALVPLLILTGVSDTLYLVMAWTFVALRGLHSLIHVSYNKVMHRFLSYCAGAIVLFAMWGRFAWQVVGQAIGS